MALTRDPGSTANTAYDIGNLSGTQTLSEFIGATDSTDIYKFSLTETSDFNLQINESSYSGSLGVYLYIDSNQNGQIDDGERLYDDDFRTLDINSALGAADYFVSVSRRNDTTNTSYTLNLSATPSPSSVDVDPGNDDTAADAYNIGSLGEIQSITEFVGSTDTRDIYKFSLTETSDFSLQIDESSYSGSLGAFLYIDSNQNGQIDDGERLYDDDFRTLDINSTLGAADYFISVSRRNDTTNTSYTLNLSAIPNPSSIDVDPGNDDTATDAYDINYINLDTSEDNRSITEFIGSTDTRDIYKFSLTQTTNFSLQVDESSYSGSLGAFLYIDSNQNGQIDDGERLHDDDFRTLDINSDLGAADYFVRISRRNDTTNTNYDLNLTYIADPVSSVSVTAEDSEAKEEGTNAGKFRITRDGDTSAAYTLNYEITTGAGQATNGVDYEELSGLVTIPAQESFVDLFVTPIDDKVAEINESVTITLREVDGDLGTGTTQTATITLEDNDEPPTFTIETPDNQASEAGTDTGTFRIRSDGDSSQPQTIEYQIGTGDNQATNGVDYAELSGFVIIPAGQDYIDLVITPIDDSDSELAEQVRITVKDINGNPGTANNQTATLAIKDNDRVVNKELIVEEAEFTKNPAQYLKLLRDFDGNDLGAADAWKPIGSVDVQGDGDIERVYINPVNGRWATVGTDITGTIDFSQHGQGGDTRVVGIYIDPLVEAGIVEKNSDFDSQRRFQNDLRIDNLTLIEGSGFDYDGDTLQEVYFKVNDGTAVLHAYMHADGNIQYSNYQSQSDLEQFMTEHEITSVAWEDWF